MLGAIVGDVIGSYYEWHNVKSEEFPLFHRFSRFTDDTVLTLAVADAILNRVNTNSMLDSRKNRKLYATKMKQYARRYPDAGYGGRFEEWMKGDSFRPYRSYGNGSAMRVSPIGLAFDSMEEVLEEAKRSAEVTHNHKKGIKGAQAVASAVFLARTGKTKDYIRTFITSNFGYNLDRTLASIRPNYMFDSSCEGSVPEAIIAFLESSDFMDALRKAISLGGDSDTIACIAGAIAHAYYKDIPIDIALAVKLKLDISLWETLNQFMARYPVI
ncbi:ADP-ribosylglycohydrolase family protein [Paenibacillus sp. N3.4]|uniref:ADP-ribosylglycohydrolase family protein n=1 Tax=Paenibacillus sp. N3.4 TaxID=2603222 RepID=UPI0011CBB864|nr:ADP-ribosylglycohydrolase family protein [Paenibacillus sp. N3.4]TXK76731.1 ADP-ribosylglycohydrolase family protein [Paenibacillus sp. N3.4]